MHIVIEGQDATGKDIQAEKLKNYLEQQEKTVVLYSESGTNSTDPFVQGIAKLNYQTDQNISHQTRSLLYLINRYHQWQNLAIPALKQGHTVITTRSWLSTLIYEGYAGGTPLEIIEKIHHLYMPKSYFHPDKSVILILDDTEREKRIATQATRKAEIFKSADQSIKQTINKSYLKVAKDYQIPTLDAAGTPDEVFARLLALFNL